MEPEPEGAAPLGVGGGTEPVGAGPVLLGKTPELLERLEGGFETPLETGAAPELEATATPEEAAAAGPELDATATPEEEEEATATPLGDAPPPEDDAPATLLALPAPLAGTVLAGTVLAARLTDAFKLVPKVWLKLSELENVEFEHCIRKTRLFIKSATSKKTPGKADE